MSDKAAVEHSNGAAPRRQRGGFKRHCARRWWIYAIIAVLLIVLIVLLIIFVAIPKMAQSKLDAAELSIDGIRVTNTQSQNYTMSINSTIRTDGSVHADIDPFVGQMYLEDLLPHTPFAEVSFPATTADSFQVVNITQFTPITDMAAFTAFNTWLLHNTTLRVTVSGYTYVHVRGLAGRSYGVTFTKTITMPGLQGFDGTNVTQANVSLQPDQRGDNFRGFVSIPNRSLVTFEIGNASFHNYLLGAEIGTVFIDDMVLVAQTTNNFSMRANISQAPVLTAIQQRPYCATGMLPFQLRGKSVVNKGQPLSYYADSLATSNQTTDINIGAALKSDVNITIACT